jgi:hypothetical protein
LLAVALGAVLFIKDRSWLGAAILGLGCFAAVITVYPLATDIYYAPLRANGLMRLLRTMADLSAAMVPSVPGVPYRYGELLPMLLGFHLGLALPIVAALALRDCPLTVGFISIYAGLVVFGTVVYELAPRHVGVLFVFFIVGLWLRREQNREPLAVWAWAWLAVMAACGVPYIATSHMQPFTKSSQMAKWAQAHGLAQELFGAWPGRAGTLLTAQLGVPTINVQKGCVNTYVRWTRDDGDLADPLKRIRASGARYIVSETMLAEGERVVTFDRGGGLQPTVHIYRFVDNEPRQLPQCQ